MHNMNPIRMRIYPQQNKKQITTRMCGVNMYGTYCTLTVDPDIKTPRIDAFASDRCLTCRSECLCNLWIWVNIITMTSHERHGVSNHRQLNPFNKFLRITTSEFCLTGPNVKGILQWPLDSPHKVQARRKAFPCYDILMPLWCIT